MELRARRWLIWSGIGAILLVSMTGSTFVVYWYALWPIPPQWVVRSSPWLEPQMRAFAKAYAKVGFKSDRYERNEDEEHVRSTIKLYGSDALPVFLTCLRSSDQDLRRQSLELLLVLPEQEQFPRDLTDELIRASMDHDPEIAYWGCWSLSYLPRELSKPAWKAILDRRLDTHYRSRENVLTFRVKKGDRDVIPSILPDLSDSRSSIRSSAVFALKEIGDSTVDEEVRKLSDDPNPDVRSAVEHYFIPREDP